MARSNVITDDLDGSSGASERRFSVNGTEYEIDLTDENFKVFLSDLSPWIDHSRLARVKRENQAPVVHPGDRSKIRAWAITNGRIVASRGRFPNDVVRDYYATMKKTPIEITLG
jgi:hypothetical protein